MKRYIIVALLLTGATLLHADGEEVVDQAHKEMTSKKEDLEKLHKDITEQKKDESQHPSQIEPLQHAKLAVGEQKKITEKAANILKKHKDKDDGAESAADALAKLQERIRKDIKELEKYIKEREDRARKDHKSSVDACKKRDALAKKAGKESGLEAIKTVRAQLLAAGVD